MASRRSARGFTLVELMVVVLIIGVLSTLSVYGVNKYLATSKSAEALTNIGGIARAVRAASARESMSGALLTANAATTSGGTTTGSSNGNSNGNGNSSGNSNGKNGNGKNGNGATVVHSVPGLCDSTTSVPRSMSSVTRKKYQPNPASGEDYNTGDRFTGWRCLQFSISIPQYYQYRYKVDGPPVDVTLPKGGTPPGLSSENTWSASAQGDLDGDGKTSWFVLEGYLSDKGEIVQAPSVATQDPEE